MYLSLVNFYDYNGNNVKRVGSEWSYRGVKFLYFLN